MDLFLITPVLWYMIGTRQNDFNNIFLAINNNACAFINYL